MLIDPTMDFGTDALLGGYGDPADVACIYCGCTEYNACPSGCSWESIDPPVCSTPACVAKLEAAEAVGDAAAIARPCAVCQSAPCERLCPRRAA